MTQYKNGLIITNDNDKINPLVICYTTAWVKEKVDNTQILESMTNAQ